ncbi:MAG: sterol desaturase family protein [Gammaproteobacteria bacterium]
MDAAYRLGAFLIVLTIMIVWEIKRPRRKNDQKRKTRWPVNFGLMILGAVLVRITVGGIVYQSAVIAAEKNIGLLNWFDFQNLISVILTLIILDLIIYGQHVASHKIPMIWKLHQVHHTDLVYDTSTGIRFHPIEIFFSLLIKVIAVFIIGATPVAVIIFEVVLNTCAVFNHGNVKLPLSLDKQLRKILVTPDMHRVHHSIHRDETDSNYGFSISIWDRLFGTYIDQPRDGHEEMTIGLDYFREPEDEKFQNVLMLPFKK